MIIKGFFDGSNQADVSEYRTLTLCAVAGTEIQWGNIEKRWNALLHRRGAPHIHTTDMLSLRRVFSETNGWSRSRVRETLEDCVSVILDCKARPESGWKHGVMPFTVTIALEDYLRASAEIETLRRPELHAAEYGVQMCGHWADHLGVRSLQLIFDRSENFYGHVKDRIDNPRARREEPAWDHVVACTEAASKDVIGLQVADVIAWAVGQKHERGIFHDWQRRLLDAHTQHQFWDYEKLKNPNRESLQDLVRWRVPGRAKLRGKERLR